MEKILSAALCLTLLLSCNSNEKNEGIDSPISKEELFAINSKLQYLETSWLSGLFNEPTDFSELVAKTVKKSNNSCSHEQISNYTENGLTTEIKENYYDLDMNEINSCDILLNTIAYYVFVEQKTTGNNREYHLFSESLIQQETSMTSVTMSQQTNTYGSLNIEDNLFEILEGSYLNLVLGLEFDENIDIEDLQELIPDVDLLYKIQFATDEDSYHFNMTLKSDAFKEIMNAMQTSESEEYTISYALYITDNTQVGFVKYVLELDTELESFDLYDLSNNLIE